jgi:DNA-3-methyladenine glycosylase II
MKKAIVHLKSADPVLCRIIEAVGPYRMEHAEPDFTALVRSIVYQQLSGKAALTIYTRLEAAVARAGKLSPRSILKMEVEELRAFGLSQGKAKYVLDLAAKTATRQVNFGKLAGMSDVEVVEHLTQVKGVGVWTAHMFLMFALRRLNVLPTGDLGIRSAVKKAYGLAELPKPGEMEEIARGWHPYCSVACWYMWRSLDGGL